MRPKGPKGHIVDTMRLTGDLHQNFSEIFCFLKVSSWGKSVFRDLCVSLGAFYWTVLIAAIQFLLYDSSVSLVLYCISMRASWKAWDIFARAPNRNSVTWLP